MAKITRKTAKLFAITGAGTDVEQFGSFEAGGAVYTTSPAVIMATPAWRLGWSSTQLDGIFAPYFQDRNAVDLVALYQVAYLLQQGVAEWDSATPYFVDSVVQSGGGLYQSLQDNNTGNAPPAGASNSFWLLMAFPTANQAKSPTRTVLTAGSGTYTPPAGCVRIFARVVGGGAGGGSANNVANFGTDGGATTFGTITANGGKGGASCNNGQTSGPGVGVGGAGGTASGGDVNIPGGVGGTGINVYPTVNKNGRGGASRFACVPAVNFNGSTNYILPGGNGPANSGAGGTGAYFNWNYSGLGWAYPGGGGGGGYAEKTIVAPTPVSYAIGAGGAGATSGGGPSYYGGNGAAGIIIIDEFYY